jgi:hypothetical protein
MEKLGHVVSRACDLVSTMNFSIVVPDKGAIASADPGPDQFEQAETQSHPTTKASCYGSPRFAGTTV